MRKTQAHEAAHNAAYIAAIGVAVPDNAIGQEEAVNFLLRHYGGSLDNRSRRVAKKVFSHPSVLQRRFAIEKLELLINEPRDRRIERFTQQAVALASQAIHNALDQTSFVLDQITALVVNTCTGYICPGLSSYLIQELGLDDRVQPYDLVGSGCGGAVPNLQLAEALLRTNKDGVVLSVSVEICSATFQMGNDLSLIVSNAIFGDGAAAAVIIGYPGEWQLVGSANRNAPEHRDAVRYVYKKGELHNQLEGNLPELVNKYATQVATDVLESKDLTLADIRFWALHTGGEKIIAAVKEGLDLTEEQLFPTRKILSEYGNMSSPTVFFVLREISSSEVSKGDYCMMVAFGAGLSANALLLIRN